MRFQLSLASSVLLFFSSYSFCETPIPPQYVSPPQSPQYSVTNRAFTGIPSLAVSPGGRLWATWYAGVTPGEDHNNYVVLSTSGDNGKTWLEVLVVDPDADGPRRTFDPELWMAPDGKLRLFWAQSIGHNCSTGGVWMMTANDPEKESADWQAPVRITDGVMMCKPMVLSSGEWVLPASTWAQTDFSAKMVVSSDAGKSWSIRGACNIPDKDQTFDEHMFVELKDGSLWLLVRTRYGIGESVSTDRGMTWPELKPSAIAHPSARFYIQRLASGNLLLVKHGPIHKSAGRSHLTAFISKDDGKTWNDGLLLDERSGVSYPDGQQTSDGLIRIIYDYSRTAAREILMAVFCEEDADAGKDVSGKVQLRQIVSKASGGFEKKQSDPKPVNTNADGVPLIRTGPGAWSLEGCDVSVLKEGVTLFSDREYILEECPAALKDARFLRIRMDGNKTLRCAGAGVVFVLTPVPERNRDSAAKALMEQGFQKAAMPEVRLFNIDSTSNYCTFYQKTCAEGDTVTIGKWGVPVFFTAP